MTMRIMRVAVMGLVLLAPPTIAVAGENPVLGTWKLKSWVRDVAATGEKINQMGERPNGDLSYSADGRMYAIITAAIAPSHSTSTRQMSSGSNSIRP